MLSRNLLTSQNFSWLHWSKHWWFRIWFLHTWVQLTRVRKSCFLFIHACQVFQNLKSASKNDNQNEKFACCSQLFCDSKLCILDCKMENIYLCKHLSDEKKHLNFYSFLEMFFSYLGGIYVQQNFHSSSWFTLRCLFSFWRNGSIYLTCTCRQNITA